MASTEGIVPITRAFLASYYDKYKFPPLSNDIARLSSEIRSLTTDLLNCSPATEGEERLLVSELESDPPHKVDENMWKNREHMEEIVFLLEKRHWPQNLQQQSNPDHAEFATVINRLHQKFQTSLKALESFQAKNSERVFNTVMTYIPQDFRGRLIRVQRERSERNKQAEVDALVNSEASIRDRYALLWRQQMDRRRMLAQLGSASGVYKALVKYLVGVPQVLLDFVRQINDDDGPMEEQRQRYGPPLYSLTTMALLLRLFILLSWGRFETRKLNKQEVEVLEQAVDVYTAEFESEVFANSPFFISAEVSGALEGRNNDDYKETSVPAGKTHEDIGFSIEYTNPSEETCLILPYRRYESDQGNFCTVEAGNYKLIWDNSYSSFFKKLVRYKVDCIPPVVEGVLPVTEVEE